MIWVRRFDYDYVLKCITLHSCSYVSKLRLTFQVYAFLMLFLTNCTGRYDWINGTFMDWWSTNTSDNYLKVEMCFENHFTGIKVGPFLVQGQNKTVGRLYINKINVHHNLRYLEMLVTEKYLH